MTYSAIKISFLKDSSVVQNSALQGGGFYSPKTIATIPAILAEKEWWVQC